MTSSAVDICNGFVRRSLPEMITDHLRANILGGVHDGRLPSERVLATRFGVSRVSIRTALEGLEAQGLILREHGRPTRILIPSAPVGARRTHDYETVSI